MKIVVKVFNWITIGICSLLIFMFIMFSILLFLIDEEGMFIGGIIFLIYSMLLILPIVVCSISNYKLKTTKTQKELVPIAIVTLILGNMISGILMLIMKDSDLLEE